jgi:hypothetical protein
VKYCIASVVMATRSSSMLMAMNSSLSRFIHILAPYLPCIATNMVLPEG